MAQRPKTTFSLYGGWLPSNPHVHRSFLNHTASVASRRKTTRAAHIDPVSKFDQAINAGPGMRELFDQIFLQAAPENTVRPPLLPDSFHNIFLTSLTLTSLSSSRIMNPFYTHSITSSTGRPASTEPRIRTAMSSASPSESPYSSCSTFSRTPMLRTSSFADRPSTPL